MRRFRSQARSYILQKTNMEKQSQTLQTFVEKLVEEKGFFGLEDEVMDQIKADLLERVEDRINAAILEHMPADKMEEFEKVLDRENEIGIQKFCNENIANLNEVVAEALMQFRSIYLNS